MSGVSEAYNYAARAADSLLNEFVVVLSQIDTEALLAIADHLESVGGPDGWMQRCIRDYVSEWR